MFNLFSNSKRVAGLEIRSDRIRFVEIINEHGFDRVTAYGEAMFDGGIHGGSFKITLSDIKKVLKTNKVNISLSDMGEIETYKKILKSIGFKVLKIMSSGEAVSLACIPKGSETSFIVVNAEEDNVDFLVYGDRQPIQLYTSDSASHTVISNLNRIYIDWYDIHKEKIDHVIFSGARAGDHDFLEYVSRETKISIHRANVFTNLDLDPEIVPIMTKNESYKYAVAIGLAIG